MESDPTRFATLRVTRRTGMFGRFRRGGFRLVVDGEESGRLHHDATVALSLPAGTHRVQVVTRGRTGADLHVDLVAGKATDVTLISQWAIEAGGPMGLRSKTAPEDALRLVLDNAPSLTG